MHYSVDARHFELFSRQLYETLDTPHLHNAKRNKNLCTKHKTFETDTRHWSCSYTLDTKKTW